MTGSDRPLWLAGTGSVGCFSGWEVTPERSQLLGGRFLGNSHFITAPGGRGDGWHSKLARPDLETHTQGHPPLPTLSLCVGIPEMSLKVPSLQTAASSAKCRGGSAGAMAPGPLPDSALSQGRVPGDTVSQPCPHSQVKTLGVKPMPFFFSPQSSLCLALRAWGH